MRFSMTVRLVALFAVLLVAGILVVARVFHRLNDVEFESVRHRQISDQARLPGESMRRELEEAWRKDGWTAVRARLDTSRERGDEIRCLVFDAGFALMGSSLDRLHQAKVTPSASGEYLVSFSSGTAGRRLESELAFTRPAIISDIGGATIGYFFPVPGEGTLESGRVFANQVWLRSIPWLAAILSISVAMIVVLLRRELRPLDAVTQAIQNLDNGNFANPVSIETSREFAPLVAAVNRASATLQRTETMRRNLVSDIAHELRTPLTNISAQLHAAEAGLLPVEPALVQGLTAELKLLTRLVEDFQQLALSDSGQLKIVLQDLPACETIRNILEPVAARLGAGLNVDIPRQLSIRADEDRLKQVLANLMDNAVRHGSSGLNVVVRSEPASRGVVLSLSDNGPGISREDRSHVFERYYRSNTPNGRKAEGSGLGLAIVRSLMRAMGGDIDYAEGPEGGASFRLTFQATG